MTIMLDGHIEVDNHGVARVAGSRIEVINLVMEKETNGLSPEELQQNFPGLSLASIYASLAYYYDHRTECDAQINDSERIAAESRAATPEAPVITRMRGEGKFR